MNLLLDPRLLFVVGKGGVGKSTLAAVLAIALARRRRRVLLVGLGGAAPRLEAPGVERLDVDGELALGEYLELVLPAPLGRRFRRSSLIRRFARAAPGLRELMAIGKVAHEERRLDVWDAIVVDSPATGHALDTLRMPGAAANAFGGLVRNEADRILGQLRDPQRTAVWLVTTPEEMPVQETIEAAAELRDRLELPLAALVVNGVERAPVDPDRIPHPPRSAAPLAATALVCAREQAVWAALHRRWIARLADAIALPTVQLPRLAEESMAKDGLERLRSVLEEQLAAAA